MPGINYFQLMIKKIMKTHFLRDSYHRIILYMNDTCYLDTIYKIKLSVFVTLLFLHLQYLHFSVLHLLYNYNLIIRKQYFLE